MKRFTLWMLFVLLLVALVPAAHAQDVGVQQTDAWWQARYWNNVSLSGDPVLLRQESSPNYAATTGSFAPAVSADNFSARYEKYIDVQAGTYRFTVTADDGVRVRVDNRLVIDKWFNQPATTYTADVELTTGYHYVVVDYYDASGNAQLQFGFAQVTPPAPANVWRAEFWNNTNLSGTPNLVTNVTDVNFDWGQSAPMSGITADNFSARFTRTVNFPAGNYRFFATSDDGVRVFVAGRLVIDQWRVQAQRTFTYDIYIPGGNTEVRVEYFDASQGAVIKVRWEVPGSTPAPTPTPPAPQPNAGEVVVEDGSSGFRQGGSASSWRTANEGSGGRLTWTRNNRTQQPGYNWARWYPTLQARRYEVFAFIPDRYTTTSAANYWVVHEGLYTRVVVNQSANGGKWVSLGTYNFRGNGQEYVSLNDITGESAFSQLIGFDAVKFVPR
jgi:hypothetical protein